MGARPPGRFSIPRRPVRPASYTAGVERIIVGCCGFPEARARYYAEFPIVEVQSTFYQLPKPETAARWRQEAPEGFVFAMKAWQLITHPATSPTYRRLREPLPGDERAACGFFQPTPPVLRSWGRTWEVAQALSARIVLFQCPASFTPSDQHIAHLESFFGQIERGDVAFVWEPRGAWPADLVRDLCERLHLVHCVDPFAGESAAGDIAYYRLHGIGGYRSRYTDHDLARLLRTCRGALASGRESAYVLFNNAAMREDARRFRALVAAPRPPQRRLAGGRSGARASVPEAGAPASAPATPQRPPRCSGSGRAARDSGARQGR